MMAAFLSGESAAHSAFARTLLPDPSPAAGADAAPANASAAGAGGAAAAAHPGEYLAAQSADLESNMCHEPALAMSGQVGQCFTH